MRNARRPALHGRRSIELLWQRLRIRRGARMDGRWLHNTAEPAADAAAAVTAAIGTAAHAAAAVAAALARHRRASVADLFVVDSAALL